MRRFMSVCAVIVLLFTCITAPVSADDNSSPEEAIKLERGKIVVREEEGLRQTNSETYLLSDGSYECVVYSEDKYYWDESGTLHPIDNAIVAKSKDGELYKNSGNSFDVYFSSTGLPTVSMTYKQHGVSFSPVSSAEKITTDQQKDYAMTVGRVDNCETLAQLTGTGNNTVRYTDVFGAADLVYVLTNSALKEYIILEDNKAPIHYSFTVTLDNLDVQQSEKNIYLTDAKGKIVFTIGNLFAVDADGAATDSLTYTIKPSLEKSSFVLTIGIDSQYMKDPDREFPIVIDPSVMVSSSQTADTSVSSAFPTTNYYLNTRLWTGYNEGYGIQRSYLRFSIPSSIPSGSVTSATLDMEYASGRIPTVHAYRVTQSWSSSTLTWNNKPSTYWNGSLVGTLRAGSSSWYSMNVTSFVQYWVNGGANYGFEVRSSNESTLSWSTFYSSDEASPHKPKLRINYVVPVAIDRMYSTYAQTEPYRDYMTSRMNCYGYAIHVFSLQSDQTTPPTYKQQPGEFAADDTSFADNRSQLETVLLDESADPEDVLNYIQALMYADFAALSATGLDWTISPTTASASVPSGYRKIALTIGVGHDYHFYVRHSDGTWSHKRGGNPITNLSPDTNIQITDSNIASIVSEAGYGDGVRYYLINKPFIVDYPHHNGHDDLSTITVFQDRAGDVITKSVAVSGSEILGKFDYPGDLDWYVFTPTTSGTYDLTVLITNAGATGFDVDMAVFNTYGNSLAVDDDAGKPEISITLTAGVRYFIRIKDSGDTIYPYEFTFELQ